MKDELAEPVASKQLVSDSSFILHPSSLRSAAILFGGDGVEEGGGVADAAAGFLVTPGGHIADQPAELAVAAGGVPVSADGRPRLAQARLRPDHGAHYPRTQSRPVLVGVRQQS